MASVFAPSNHKTTGVYCIFAQIYIKKYTCQYGSPKWERLFIPAGTYGVGFTQKGICFISIGLGLCKEYPAACGGERKF